MGKEPAGPENPSPPVSAAAQTVLSDTELGGDAELFTLVARSTAELIAYHNRAYAERFAASVRAVAAAEDPFAAARDLSAALTAAG